MFCRALCLRNLRKKDLSLKPETLGQHLKSRRLLRMLTQDQAAAQMNTLREHYAHWERVDVAPTASYWPRIIVFPGHYPGKTISPADKVLQARRSSRFDILPLPLKVPGELSTCVVRA